MAAAVLVAAAAVVLVRVSGNDRPPGRSAAPTASPTPAASPTPRPPYDRRPGRTPIPAPTQLGDRLSGTLPELGGPDLRAARAAADLVLGRYCADPSRYALSVSGEDGYRRIIVYVSDVHRSGGPVQQWGLQWTGRSYQWFGPVFLAEGC